MTPRRFLACLSALCFVSSLALAAEPPLARWAKDRVQTGLVAPLASRDTTRFSRVRISPRERRIRITRTTAMHDKKGGAFVPFAIDVRFRDDEWHRDDVVGCVYQKSGAVYVKRGTEYRPAEFLLGKNVGAVPGVCETAPSA